MSYIGAQPTTGSFPFDQFSGNGSTTAFTLTYAPASTSSIIVAVSGVVQNPNTYSVSGSTLTFTGAPPSGTDNIAVLYLGLPSIVGVPNAGTVSTETIANGAVTSDKLSTQAQYTGFKNRIINGDCRIAQRGTAAVTANGSYVVDRFLVQNGTDGAFSAQQDTSAPVGFVNSIKWTTTTADGTLTTTQQASIQQRIEGTNVSDLAFGTANAKTVTVSFWVRSSLTGTFGGSLRNSASDRSYPFTYSISVADTWEQKSVTIAGDTSGTWLTTTGIGLVVTWGLGAGPDRSGTADAWNSNNNNTATGAVSVIGTLNATWYITGVQLEKGSTATSFDYRPYGTELALCQRYYQRVDGFSAMGGSGVTTVAYGTMAFPVTMRSSPSVGATAAIKLTDTAADYTQSSASVAVMIGTRVSSSGLEYQLTNFTGLTALRPLFSIPNETGAIALSAEL